jgi:hypothetical protein
MGAHGQPLRWLAVIRFEAPTVLLQWAAGGLLFLWVTTRGRLVGLGYGWLMRSVFCVIAILGLVAAYVGTWVPGRDLPAIGLVFASVVALIVSVVRKEAGVFEQRAAQDRKRERVASMTTAATGDAPGGAADNSPSSAAMQMRDQFGRAESEIEQSFSSTSEFPPVLDLIPPMFGFIGVIGGALHAASGDAPVWLAIARLVVGALFLGAVSDAMLLGHWYLVQPGLSRNPIHELNDWLLRLWPVEVILLLVPTGMIQALTGSVKDGWGGILAWFWCACAAATGVLGVVTKIALRERYYSAVMAATGFLYLAILMAFCTDLIGRAILS